MRAPSGARPTPSRGPGASTSDVVLAPDERSMPTVPCQPRSLSVLPSVPFPASQSWLCVIRHERSKLNQPVEFSTQTSFAARGDDGKDDGHGPHPRHVNPSQKSQHAIGAARRARQVDPRQIERDNQDVDQSHSGSNERRPRSPAVTSRARSLASGNADTNANTGAEDPKTVSTRASSACPSSPCSRPK